MLCVNMELELKMIESIEDMTAATIADNAEIGLHVLITSLSSFWEQIQNSFRLEGLQPSEK